MSGSHTDPALRSQLSRLTTIARDHSLSSLQGRIASATATAGSTTITVAVLGQFKAGKSSLLNSLLGEPLLPVRAIPATSVVTTVRSGPAPEVMVHANDGRAFGVTNAELSDYVTEQGNPGNARGVAAVEVISPNLSRFPHLVFVDTPGLGSVYELNTRAAVDWLPNVGAAILAVAATQPLSSADVDLLRNVVLHTPHVVLVLTKADLLSPDDLRVVTDFLTEAVPGEAPLRPPIFTFSVKPGFEPQREALFSHLEARLEQHHTAAAEALLAHRVRQLTNDCRGYLRLALAGALAAAEDRQRLRRMLDEEKANLPRTLREAGLVLRPVKQAVEHTCVKFVGACVASLSQTLSTDLAAWLPQQESSLARETADFTEWLGSALDARIRTLSVPLLDALQPHLEEVRVELLRLSETYTARIGTLVRSALRVDFAPTPPPAPLPDLKGLDVHTDRVFDSQLPLLSWATPMFLARPLVHRHFARKLPWEVEKNLLRLAYRVAQSTAEAIDEAVEALVRALRCELDTCIGLIGTGVSDVAALEAAFLSLSTDTESPKQWQM